jgi:tRNA A37 threonylcarbamoyladenosine dehydratase
MTYVFDNSLTEQQRHFESLNGDEKVKVMGELLKNFNPSDKVKDSEIASDGITYKSQKQIRPIPKGML